MPLIPSLPASGPTAPASTGSRVVARAGDQETAQPGSFGEAMARSRKSGFEKAAEPAIRHAPAKVVRRAPDDDDITAQGSVSPNIAHLVPQDAMLATAAIAITVEGNSATVGRAEAAKTQADSAIGGLNTLLAAAPAVLGGLVDASGSKVATHAAADSTSVLVATTPKGFDLTQAKSRETPTGDGGPLAADPRAITTQADAADQGMSDLSFGPPGKGPDRLAAALDRQVEQAQVADSAPVAGTGALVINAGTLMQQTISASAPSTPAPTVSAILLPEVGSSEWGKALGQQVIHLSAGDRQMAELQLNPPGLGPLKITLSVSDQQMQAAFVSAHSSVRTAVETALPQLRALLAENGISLGQTSVGAESQPQTAFAGGQGSFASQSPRQGYPGTDADKAEPSSDQPTAVKRRSGQGLRINTYA